MIPVLLLTLNFVFFCLRNVNTWMPQQNDKLSLQMRVNLKLNAVLFA